MRASAVGSDGSVSQATVGADASVVSTGQHAGKLAEHHDGGKRRGTNACKQHSVRRRGNGPGEALVDRDSWAVVVGQRIRLTHPPPQALGI